MQGASTKWRRHTQLRVVGHETGLVDGDTIEDARIGPPAKVCESTFDLVHLLVGVDNGVGGPEQVAIALAVMDMCTSVVMDSSLLASLAARLTPRVF